MLVLSKTASSKACEDPEGGGGGGGGAGVPRNPLKNHKNIEFSGSPENRKATMPALNVGPSSAHQRNAIQWGHLMVFRWRAGDGPLIVVLGSPLPLPAKNIKEKKNVVKVGPPLTKLSGSAHAKAQTSLRMRRLTRAFASRI